MEKELLHIEAFVAYHPLPDEPDFRHSPFFGDLDKTYVFLTQNKDNDPFALAENTRTSLLDKRVAILIPGTKFDARGTRHGRGNGWYDRFLSRVPQTWVRIGVAHQERVLSEPLVRAPWDEPVDWLLIDHGNNLWTNHQTHARD
jgi:5,10-methenyltetrahydrofolate synthetase